MIVLVAFVSNTLFNFVVGLLLARFLGPEDYGRFALALAIATGVQTLAFDWARVASARFYSQKVADEQPKLRATVDAALALMVAIIGICALAALLSGLTLPLSRGLVVLSLATAIVNGFFDYQTALIRARFLDRLYARLIFTKNLLSVGLTLGGAFWFGSAGMTLVGLCLSMTGALLGVRRALADRRSSIRLVDPALARTLFRYALPIVVANLVYQTIPLADRLLIAQSHGFAQSGQFSLAYDIGIRVVAALGSALDVMLFQIAVRADEIHGTPEAKRQIGDNIGIVFAVLTPACVGLWVVLPSFEQVVVPSDFRGPFAQDLRWLLPGLFCYGMIFFAIQPLFQIHKRTAPLIVVALVAGLANGAALWVQPQRSDVVSYAEAQGLALCLALVLLSCWAATTSPVWPRRRDLLGGLGATGAMTATLWTVRALDPGVGTLMIQVALGVATYGAIAYMLDLCAIRSRILTIHVSKQR